MPRELEGRGPTTELREAVRPEAPRGLRMERQKVAPWLPPSSDVPLCSPCLPRVKQESSEERAALHARTATSMLIVTTNVTIAEPVGAFKFKNSESSLVIIPAVEMPWAACGS